MSAPTAHQPSPSRVIVTEDTTESTIGLIHFLKKNKRLASSGVRRDRLSQVTCPETVNIRSDGTLVAVIKETCKPFVTCSDIWFDSTNATSRMDFHCDELFSRFHIYRTPNLNEYQLSPLDYLPYDSLFSPFRKQTQWFLNLSWGFSDDQSQKQLFWFFFQ